MSQLINFENLKSKGAWQAEDCHACEESDNAQRSLPLVFDNEIKLTLQILVYNNPNKINFAPKEAAEQLGVGEEFVRRRIKSKKIKTVYFGDKPMIHIAELARIITEGI